jgi:hypothetical protein
MRDLILRNEPYVAQYKPRKIIKKRLVLRDEHGKIRLTAKDPCQERKIITLADEDELTTYLNKGWQLTRELRSRKMLIAKTATPSQLRRMCKAHET